MLLAHECLEFPKDIWSNNIEGHTELLGHIDTPVKFKSLQGTINHTEITGTDIREFPCLQEIVKIIKEGRHTLLSLDCRMQKFIHLSRKPFGSKYRLIRCSIVQIGDLRLTQGHNPVEFCTFCRIHQNLCLYLFLLRIPMLWVNCNITGIQQLHCPSIPQAEPHICFLRLLGRNPYECRNCSHILFSKNPWCKFPKFAPHLRNLMKSNEH